MEYTLVNRLSSLFKGGEGGSTCHDSGLELSSQEAEWLSALPLVVYLRMQCEHLCVCMRLCVCIYMCIPRVVSQGPHETCAHETVTTKIRKRRKKNAKTAVNGCYFRYVAIAVYINCIFFGHLASFILNL